MRIFTNGGWFMRVLVVSSLLLVSLIVADFAIAQTRGVSPGREAEAWAGVGILQVRGGGMCSAALLDERTVLTAAHCVYPRETKQLARPENVTFLAGWRDGITAAKRTAVRIVAHRDYDPTRPRRSDVASINEDCEAGSRQGDILLLSCESHPGMSGAPIFSYRGGDPRIIALISGSRTTRTGKNNGIALAVDAPLGRVQIDAKATRTMARASLPFWSARAKNNGATQALAQRKVISAGSGFGLGDKGDDNGTGLGRKTVRPPSSSQ